MKETEHDEKLVGFYPYILMGYMESANFLWTDTETVKDRALARLDSQSQSPPHLLEPLVKSTQEYKSTDSTTPDNTQYREWVKLSPQARATALAYAKFYLNNFTRIVWCIQEERTHMTRLLFKNIDSLFLPNDAANKDRLEPISIQKLNKGNASCITTMTVLC